MTPRDRDIAQAMHVLDGSKDLDYRAPQRPVAVNGNAYLPCGHATLAFTQINGANFAMLLLASPIGPIGLSTIMTPATARMMAKGLNEYAAKEEAEASGLATAALKKAAGK